MLQAHVRVNRNVVNVEGSLYHLMAVLGLQGDAPVFVEGSLAMISTQDCHVSTRNTQQA